QVCANAGTPQFRNPPVNFDETPTVLDNLFFKNMVFRNKTTMLTDSHLINDPRTIPIVQQMANQDGLWQQRFPEVMDKMSAMNVLTGNNGEVRKTCRSTN
ncbi:peroxidase 21, partial [Trifolium medium]|nr:peroxidase 21 [Trifolium medium]